MTDGKKPATYMVIDEVTVIPDGEPNAGDLVLAVTAVRREKTYKLPYVIKAAMIANVDVDVFTQRVNADLDEREKAASMASVVIKKFEAKKGLTIDLSK